MDSHSFILNALIFMGAAVVAVPISKKLGFGSVLGYLIAGAAIGPWGLRLITDVENILKFSELGVVFLLFLIGLELNPHRLWSLRKSVFGVGATQVVLTALLMGGALSFFDLGWTPSLIIGLGLSLSSTAFVLQILSEKNELTTQYGRSSFAILLFQDLAVIPMMAMIPLLSMEAIGSSESMAWSTTKVTAVIIAVIVGGRFIIRPAFRLIAGAQAKEIFTAASLLLVLGIAGIMETIGLSPGLGAFLAGVLFSDSEYRHELEADIEPFKGLLLGLFFVAVGMSVDFGLVLRDPGNIFLATLGLMVLKGMVLFGIGKASGLGTISARNMALVLPQGGEFAFVLFGVAAQENVLNQSWVDFLVVVVVLSMAFTPILVLLNERFLNPQVKKKKKPFDTIDEKNPVIIAGFGRFGQIVGRVLRMRGIGFTALEHDSEHVEVVRRFGSPIYYGDASRVDLLESAGAKQAKFFILAIDDIESSMATAEVVKKHFPNLKILARARNRPHAFKLLDMGIECFWRETFESSLSLTRQLLSELGLKSEEVEDSVQMFREHDEKTLLEQHKIHHDEKEMINYSKKSALQLTELFKADRKD